MRTVWVSFDTIGRDCLEAAADVGRGDRRSRHAAGADRPESLGAVLVRRGRSPSRGRAHETRDVNSEETHRGGSRARARPRSSSSGWSQLVRDPFIALAREGVFGMHPTLLPRHRGRAPIPWTILTGLARTGVTLFEIVDATADSGSIVGQVTLDVARDETATTLFARIAQAHVELTRELVPQLSRARHHASRRTPPVRAPGPSALPRTGSSTGRRVRRTSTTGCARRRGRIRVRSRFWETRR